MKTDRSAMGSPAPRQNDDDDLARQARAGDPQALEQLALRVLPQLRRWSLAILGDPVTADDAVQESLVRLLRFIDRYDGARPLRPWLRSLVRSACADVQRGSSRAARTPAQAPRPASDDPGRHIDLGRGAATALQAFGALSPRQREVWMLCHREGHTAAEAARQLDIAPGTARALLYQARRTLRRHLLTEHPDLLELVRPT
jgi:RNA polymerase sigma-70 factor (ECF subfamily)